MHSLNNNVGRKEVETGSCASRKCMRKEVFVWLFGCVIFFIRRRLFRCDIIIL